MFVTDVRSGKVAEVAESSAAEVAWYFPDSREQYRVMGELVIVGESHHDAALADARVRAWDKMSEKGREQFAWPHPGQPRDDQGNPTAFDVDPNLVGKGSSPHPNFCLVVLHVAAVDHLSLRKNRRHRWALAAGADASDAAAWTEEELNP